MEQQKDKAVFSVTVFNQERHRRSSLGRKQDRILSRVQRKERESTLKFSN